MPAALFVVMTKRLSMPAGWPELIRTMFFGPLGAAGALLAGPPSLTLRVGAQPIKTTNVARSGAMIFGVVNSKPPTLSHHWSPNRCIVAVGIVDPLIGSAEAVLLVPLGSADHLAGHAARVLVRQEERQRNHMLRPDA